MKTTNKSSGNPKKDQEEKFYSKFIEKRTPKPSKKAKSAAKKDAPHSEKQFNSKQKTYHNGAQFNSEKNTTKRFTPKKISPDAAILSCNPSFNTKSIPKDAREILNDFDKIIQENRPLNSKQIQQLPENIRELSHQLTDKRADRRLGYMNENTKLSAYVRYFTWWNLVRLTRLFANLPSQAFPQNDCVCIDLGSGPLTVITALWLARPELRTKKLTWYCLDISQNSMTLGEDLYYSVAARTIAKSNANDEETLSEANARENQKTTEACWKIIRVKGSFGTQIKEKADFITCANMFNELDQAGDMPPEFQTKKYFDQLMIYSSKNARFILIEPGVPKAARTISLLRDRFIKAGKQILAPCPHAFECPMNGFKAYTGSSNKWCNFAFSTEDAPNRLQKLSDNAKLPKERATLSYVCAVPEEEIATQNEDDATSPRSDAQNGTDAAQNTSKAATLKNKDATLIRVVSDSFRLPGGRTGVYACSKFGLTLLSMQENGVEMANAAGQNSVATSKNTTDANKNSTLNLNSGDLLEVKIKTPVDSLCTDEKTGAKVIAI